MPPQVVRLVLLTLAIVATYSLGRYVLTPVSFGQYGWYRGAALEELAARPPVYGGRKSCEECHSDVTEKLAKAEHKNISCEACHGVSRAHAEAPDAHDAIKMESHCGRCHEADPCRPGAHKQIKIKQHYTGQKCTECHLPHQPNEVP